MKLKNVLLTLGLALGVGAATGVALLSKAAGTPFESKASSETVWYLRGSMNDWGVSDEYKIVENGAPLIIKLEEKAEFKIDDGTWNTSKTEGTGDAVSDGKITFSTTGGNTYVNETGTYAISVKDGQVYADFGVYYYSGDANSWKINTEGTDEDHPTITLNGDTVTWNLTENDKFKIRNDNWNYGRFGFSNLKDKDFYKSFTNDSDGNIVVNIGGQYDVTLKVAKAQEWVLRIVPHGVNPDETAFVYVLDKYGSLLHENHYAYISSTDGYTTGTPEAIMESYPDTNHMYQQEFWTGMQNVEFNNNSDWSWKWDISVDGEWTNRGKCLILDGSTDGDGKWSSNVWVEPETAKFIENCMHFANYNEQQQGDGYCVSAGWYDTAVRAYEALEEKYQKEICSLPDVLERLQKWAIANEEHFVVTDGVGAFGSSVTPVLGFLNNSDNNATAMIVVTVTFVSMVGVAGFFFLRRRKEQ